VLKPGGVFLFSVWDRIEANDFADVIAQALATMFPADPPRFMARTPHGYHDRAAIERDLTDGGFAGKPAIDTIAARSKAKSAGIAATAYCHGTPWRGEIEARGSLEQATAAAAEALAARFGRGAVDGAIQAHIVMVTK